MADLTIKYKGNPILELSESGTKTLKTAGKYCEDNISVDYAKPAGGGGSGFAETIVTDAIENHIVSSSWSPSVTAVENIPKKYYYNGVLLPEIPPDVLAQYPYAWIRENTKSGYYDLILTKVAGYYDPAAGSNPGIVYGAGAAGTESVQYRVSITNADSVTS